MDIMETQNNANSTSQLCDRLAELKPESNDRYAWTDIGNGRLFADWFKDKARYVPERKKWFVYDERVWRPDIDNIRVMEFCKDLADMLMYYAQATMEDESKREAYVEYVSKWQQRSKRETILKDAKSVHPVNWSEFDSDPMLFNCLNGTLDLNSGQFHLHNPSDLLTKLSGVAYDPHARCERWEQFGSEIMVKDDEKIIFLQKALGYTLTGKTNLECFFILYGPSTRNGKGTCMETVVRLLGDYGKSARPETFTQKKASNGSGPSEDIARLAGARFVNVSEPDKKMQLSAALVKTLTGSDTINARFLNENSLEFKPQFKLFINTNHLPTVTDNTLFSSGRVMVIPFERHFVEHERDAGLKAELGTPESLSGILNWCLKGLQMLNETGLIVPGAVKEATDEYRQQSDKIGRFLAEEMEFNSSAETPTKDVYDIYRQWCASNGHHPESLTNFGSMLRNVAQVERKRPAGTNRDANKVMMLLGYRRKSNPNLQMVSGL